jgi:hypothetical protein
MRILLEEFKQFVKDDPYKPDWKDKRETEQFYKEMLERLKDSHVSTHHTGRYAGGEINVQTTNQVRSSNEAIMTKYGATGFRKDHWFYVDMKTRDSNEQKEEDDDEVQPMFMDDDDTHIGTPEHVVESIPLPDIVLDVEDVHAPEMGLVELVTQLSTGSKTRVITSSTGQVVHLRERDPEAAARVVQACRQWEEFALNILHHVKRRY